MNTILECHVDQTIFSMMLKYELEHCLVETKLHFCQDEGKIKENVSLEYFDTSLSLFLIATCNGGLAFFTKSCQNYYTATTMLPLRKYQFIFPQIYTLRLIEIDLFSSVNKKLLQLLSIFNLSSAKVYFLCVCWILASFADTYKLS